VPPAAPRPKQTSAAVPESGAFSGKNFSFFSSSPGSGLGGHRPQQPGQTGTCLAPHRAVEGTGVFRGEMGSFNVFFKISLQNLALYQHLLYAPAYKCLIIAALNLKI